ncbi:MAG: hypothetical protein WA421_14950 [Nitrososphaeraceae archaeon]
MSLISLIVVFSIGNPQHYKSYTEGKDRGSHSNNPLVSIADNNNIFGNLAKQFSSFTKQFEYRVDLDGKQIFPNEILHLRPQFEIYAISFLIIGIYWIGGFFSFLNIL